MCKYADNMFKVMYNFINKSYTFDYYEVGGLSHYTFENNIKNFNHGTDPVEYI